MFRVGSHRSSALIYILWCVCVPWTTPLFCRPSNTEGVSPSRRLMTHRMQAARPVVEFIAINRPHGARSPIFEQVAHFQTRKRACSSDLHPSCYFTCSGICNNSQGVSHLCEMNYLASRVGGKTRLKGRYLRSRGRRSTARRVGVRGTYRVKK